MKIDPANLNLREAHRLHVGVIVPRPIAFVSTIGNDAVFDVAPFSSFMLLTTKPNFLAFTISCRRDGQKKRTLINIESSREFVVNVVTEQLAEAMNQSSANYPSHVDKFKAVGLTAVNSDIIKAPMVAESPVNMECRAVQIQEFGEPPRRTTLIIGEVLLVHVKDEIYSNGEIQMSKLRAIGRLGGDLYCRTSDAFIMEKPYEPL